MKLRETEDWAEFTAAQRIAVLVYVAAEYAFLLALPLALLVALADVRAGGYLLIVALTFHLVGRLLAVREFARAMEDVKETPPERWTSLVGTACLPLLAVGLFAALAGWELGAYVAVGALVGLLVSHVVVGVLAYRRVMARPWPEVPPVVDDDW